MQRVDVVVIGAGQSGLATTRALRQHGLTTVVVEAARTTAGSWPRYYDSLTLFSPARYSALPGMPFPGGDPDRHPHRDEVVAYLTAYAGQLDAEIRTGRRVSAVRRSPGGFEVECAGGERLTARAVVAASGTFGRPYRPDLAGLDTFTGTVLHSADYRSPQALAGTEVPAAGGRGRVVVVGSGNSAVQIATELAAAGTSRVTLAARRPVSFARQRILGRDLHFWLRRTGIDIAPAGRFLRTPPTQLVIDDGRYRAAIERGSPDQRELFTAVDGAEISWTDGAREEVDVLLLATGYRPDLPFLTGLPGALTPDGHPRHREGLSTSVPGLAFVGLEWQRSLSSNSLRGVGRDAARIARHLAAGLARN
ncbi:FAD-binding protein [Streptomyces triticagri]|uniref:FAD-binding protein n=1 Tax=Streptomyces triticagri TaxID=2293568 RepID=A0A372LXS6_9ACTN|nr:NAD(P)/FAD-dependent oxidoreductase [Streptomyces triticagri]RFU83462.1 FAD-binding protein [Streptomyces triticagri]